MNSKVAFPGKKLSVLFPLLISALFIPGCFSIKSGVTIPINCQPTIPVTISIQSPDIKKVSEVYKIGFSNPFEATISTTSTYEADFYGHSILIYQCAFCAPRTLMKGDAHIAFSLDEFFNSPEQAGGVFYLSFTQSKYQDDFFIDSDCLKDYVLTIRLKK